MGLEFDRSGKFLGWSSLFKYSSIEALEASLELPLPLKKTYKKSDNGINIDDWIDELAKAQREWSANMDKAKNDAERYELTKQKELKEITTYVNLLETLNSKEATKITYTHPYGDTVFRAINDHEFTLLPNELQENSIKNFVSHRIQSSVQNLRNAILAYSPITVDDLQDAAENSPKGELSSKMTMFNPSTKLLMQFQNITGRNVIGISANGMKALFMWNYYINEAIRSGDADKIARAKIDFTTTRIKGRALFIKEAKVGLYGEAQKHNVVKVISGGQTGGDTLGLLVAHSLGIETGGTAPKNFARENFKDLKKDDLKNLGLVEISDEDEQKYWKQHSDKQPNLYSARTYQNVKNSDATVYFGKTGSGMTLTKNSAIGLNRPFIANPTAELLRLFLINNNVKVLNVAGNRKLDNELEVKLVLADALNNQKTDFENIHLVTTQKAHSSTLPGVNFEGVSPEILEEFKDRQIPKVLSDLMSSQMVSAATDNARELILAKINAGSKLAKMYMFLITMGYDAEDIVSFMTSPVVTFIDTITENNLFMGHDLSITEAINVALGDFYSLAKRCMSNYTYSHLSDEERYAFSDGDVEELKNPWEDSKYDIRYQEFEDARLAILEAKALMDYKIDDDTRADLEEFLNVLDAANEFSKFGQILGLNLGASTDKVGLDNKFYLLASILLDENTECDGIRYCLDKNYRQDIIRAAESTKKVLNIYDAIDTIQHFDSMYTILGTIGKIDSVLSIKSKVYSENMKKLRQEFGYIPEDYAKRTIHVIDLAIIARFVGTLQSMSIPYKKGTSIFNANRKLVQTTEDGSIRFDSMEDIETFKYYFELVIIPNLREGKIITKKNGVMIEKEFPEIKANKFILGLIKSNNKQTPLYKVDLDLLAAKNSLHGVVTLASYIKGLNELKNGDYNIGGNNLRDLFVLYNLIVNQNLYGSDRMTTLFKGMVEQEEELSLLNKYFNYVSNLDYYVKPSDLNISLEDILRGTAKTVSSTIGYQDPSLIVNTDDGPVLMQRVGYSYVPMPDFLSKMKGEREIDFLIRMDNYTKYNTLGGVYTKMYETLVLSILNIDPENLAKTIFLLQADGILVLQKRC